MPNALTGFLENHNIYLEGALISRELILQKYARFLASVFSGDTRSASVALHTGSVCFDAVTVVIAALSCLFLDITTPDDVVDSLRAGDLVMYENLKYRWLGIEEIAGERFLALERDGQGRHGPIKRMIPYEDAKYIIKPYGGMSDLTGGRGVRKTKDTRREFIARLFDIDRDMVASVVGTSVVFVAERSAFDYIVKNTEIGFGNPQQRIKLLDIVSASYYTNGNDAYQFGSNPAKEEPALKVAGKISVARELALARNGNKVIGFIAMDAAALPKDNSEWDDVQRRQFLHFVHLASDKVSENMQNAIDTTKDAAVFACTKEFFLQDDFSVRIKNALTLELDKQVTGIVNSTLTTVVVEGGGSWADIQKVREALRVIRHSVWSDAKKNEFMIAAYSLLNLFTTAAFPLHVLESQIASGQLNISSPMAQINVLRELSKLTDAPEPHCTLVIDTLLYLYQMLAVHCPKYDILRKYLLMSAGQQIAVIVPKPYYADAFLSIYGRTHENVSIITANRFDGGVYDKIITVGDFANRRFDPLTCTSAADIVVLLYASEAKAFGYKKHKIDKLAKMLNRMSGIEDVEQTDDNMSSKDEITYQEEEKLAAETIAVERYLDSISVFDIRKFAVHTISLADNVPKAEVCAVGDFVTGEKILFSKYYIAVVFDETEGTVSEKKVEKLLGNERIIFTRRDIHTKNMVDYIYDSLHVTNRLQNEVATATEKAGYWKKVLRTYKIEHDMSCREIADALRLHGCSLGEMTIRQWLAEDSHIISPRNEQTLSQIAALTNDARLSDDVPGYFEACRVVKRQRREILKLIGTVITERLQGRAPSADDVLKVVYENVESLSEILELDSVTLLEEPVSVPIGVINKPLSTSEVSL